MNTKDEATEALEALGTEKLALMVVDLKRQLNQEIQRNKETDRDFAGLERTIDAVKEVLHCVTYNQTLGSRDAISMANRARELIMKAGLVREELPF
jgi:hypothetical protein